MACSMGAWVSFSVTRTGACLATIDADDTAHHDSIAFALRKPLHRELSDLADLNRPSMCSEVSKMLRELAAKVKAGTA